MDKTAARNVKDFCRETMPPLCNVVPGGEPLRGDLAHDILSVVLGDTVTYPRGGNSRNKDGNATHTKSPPRPSNMESMVVEESPEPHPLSPPHSSIRRTASRRCKIGDKKDTQYAQLLDTCAIKLHSRGDMEPGQVKTICQWLNRGRNWAGLVKSLRAKYYKAGNRIMYKHTDLDVAKIRKRTGKIKSKHTTCTHAPTHAHTHTHTQRH